MRPGFLGLPPAVAVCLGLVACTGPEVVAESLQVEGQSYSLRFTPTGDTVPNFALGSAVFLADGTTALGPVDPFVSVAYPTVRIGGASDKFEALAVWFFRCAPGETFDPADYGDEVFSLDDRTREYVFTYPCPPLSGESGEQG